MSKAFTKDEGDPGPGAPVRLPSPLPAGAKNYVTPGGLKTLREDLERHLEERRLLRDGAAVGNTTRSDLTEPRQALESRIVHLRESLESAVVVNPPAGNADRVRFGATVSVRHEPGGEAARYRIVGADEADVARGWVSWFSPIARALTGARVGDRVHLSLPSGQRELEIVTIEYE